MRIQDLLNKYFEGETTCAEERELRKFFTQKHIPEKLMVYKPLFNYMEEENQSYRKENKKRGRIPVIRYMKYACGSIAAGVLLIIGMVGVNKHLNATPKNQVWINGIQYTEPDLILEQAQAAFNDVSFSKEEIFEALFEE